MSGTDDDQVTAATAAAAGSTGRAVPDDPAELRQEIERTREQLGETVDQLAAKADVKKQAQDRAAELRTRIQARAAGLASRAGQLATKAQGVVGQGAARAPRPPLPIVVGVAAGGVLLAGYLVIRRRSGTG
jgi:cobalamin biosynthesis Mg chelatase CobN